MDSLEETTKNISSKMGFFKHVFNFDDDSKSEMLNIIQYALIALIPIVILNKSMQKYVPEADDEKGSLELVAEILIQVIVMFLGLLIINRIITYIPTYSGVKYPDFNITYIILAVLIITLSLQTKLGEKVCILYERVLELWEGKHEDNGKKCGAKSKGKGNVKVSQPISQNGNNAAAMNQSLYNDNSTSISQLPALQEQQQMPDYNAMHRNDNNPLVGAATPGGAEAFEPMAANDALGGSAWSNF